ncbi:MAG TPA: hypothetical protein VKZ45_06745 [Vicingaceae bacterium]|nr:hypothetical protein [Vicingaceae bacterium]
MSKKHNILFLALFASVVMGLYVYELYNKSYLGKNFNVAGGKIIKYSIVSSVNDNIITYEYFVDGNRYYRKFTTLNQTLDSCYDNIKNCQGYRLMVVYSNEDNSKSLINLNRLYIEGEQINKEELDLDDFK